MPSLQFLSIQKDLPLSSSLSLSVSKITSNGKRKPHPFPSSSSSCIVHAKERDSQQFEVDPDKARQALQELDQQLDSLSKKQIIPPKIKVRDQKFSRNRMREEMPEISESFLANAAVILFLISIFYNVLFFTVIKPSIDIPEFVSITSESESK